MVLGWWFLGVLGGKPGKRWKVVLERDRDVLEEEKIAGSFVRKMRIQGSLL